MSGFTSLTISGMRFASEGAQFHLLLRRVLVRVFLFFTAETSRITTGSDDDCHVLTTTISVTILHRAATHLSIYRVGVGSFPRRAGASSGSTSPPSSAAAYGVRPAPHSSTAWGAARRPPRSADRSGRPGHVPVRHNGRECATDRQLLSEAISIHCRCIRKIKFIRMPLRCRLRTRILPAVELPRQELSNLKRDAREGREELRRPLS